MESAQLGESVDYLQAEALETRNDSPSASQPMPISNHADIEANWNDEENSREQETSQGQSENAAGSLRDVSSSAVTAIWRGFDAVGRVAGFQRRASAEELDRNR